MTGVPWPLTTPSKMHCPRSFASASTSTTTLPNLVSPSPSRRLHALSSGTPYSNLDQSGHLQHPNPGQRNQDRYCRISSKGGVRTGILSDEIGLGGCEDDCNKSGKTTVPQADWTQGVQIHLPGVSLGCVGCVHLCCETIGDSRDIK